jgi:hypothetical protein
MDWFVFAWSVFVLFTYIGGFFIGSIGALTTELSKVYAIVLILSIVVGISNTRNKTKEKSENK